MARAQRTTDPKAALVGPLGSLGLSVVIPNSATASLRAIRWHQDLERLGVTLPLFLVHDLGLALSLGAEQLRIEPRCTDLGSSAGANGRAVAAVARLQQAYFELIAEARQSEVARQAAELGLADEVIATVLARVLGSVAQAISVRPTYSSAMPLDASLFEGLRGERLARLFAAADRRFEIAALQALLGSRLLVLTLVDALDLDTLRLFGLLGSSAEGPLGQVELLASLEAPETNDVVNFSLEILPTVLETKAQPAAGTVAEHGYAGLGRRGSIDSMVLTELAWDDAELGRRILDNEVLYYAREQSHEQGGRLHHLLVDASASMRGDRSTFARAMALATGKKLLLEGDDVEFRFFDSRLYDPLPARGGDLPTPSLLSFRGERGRNPTRVFTDLVTALELSQLRDSRLHVVHLFTHAALYIPRSLVSAVRALAPLTAVFMLPSAGRLELDYLDLLDAHWVVDHGVLEQRQERADAARSILTAGSRAGRATAVTGPPPGTDDAGRPPAEARP